MRIISGKFKSTKLFIPTDKSTRPLRDVVKESIFNTIAHSNKFSFHLEKVAGITKHNTVSVAKGNI